MRTILRLVSTSFAVIALHPLIQHLPPCAASEPSAKESRASAENPHKWNSRTTSVSVFKNGLGFFTREGEVTLNDGWGHAAEVPPATFGTLAIYSTDSQQLVDLVAVGDGELVEFKGSDEPTRSLRLKTFESALHSSVELTLLENSQTKMHTGKLDAISGNYAVLETENGTIAIRLEQVVALRRKELPLRFHVTDDRGTNVERAKVNMAYLRGGIVWIPEYTLKIIDDETAELTLRGTLVNEAEDLLNCNINFVVGVPHFVHTDLLSPLAVGHAIRSIGNAMPMNGVPQQVMSQMMNRAAITTNAMNYAPGTTSIATDSTTQTSNSFRELVGNLPREEAVGAGDYSVYTKENITVRKGERAVVTLMTKKIRYEHLYSWDTSKELEHRLVLHNKTDIPWTTGPCLALSGNQPLSEDILKYTPVNGRGELTVTTAINIAKKVSESEVDRKLKAHEPQPHQYLDLVQVKGSLQLMSFEKKPIQIQISKVVQGKPSSISESGTIQNDSQKLRLTERSGTLTWQLTLEPMKEVELSYTYERYVPSN